LNISRKQVDEFLDTLQEAITEMKAPHQNEEKEIIEINS
jgi:cell division septum initiation protein DivIVA